MAGGAGAEPDPSGSAAALASKAMGKLAAAQAAAAGKGDAAQERAARMAHKAQMRARYAAARRDNPALAEEKAAQDLSDNA